MSEPAPACTQFVILAAPRTGSNWLASLLNSHPDVLCHHEIFNPAGIFYALDYRDGLLDLGTMEERDREPIAFLDRVWGTPLGRPCVGFKMTRGQDERVLRAVLADRAVRKIVLRRRNILRTYVSEIIAQKTGRWEVYDRSGLPGALPAIRVEPGELHQHRRMNESFYERIEQELHASSQTFLTVWYEQLFGAAGHAPLLAFLKVSQQPLAAKSVQQNPGRLSELISNYSELQASLAGSEREALLDAEQDARACL